MDGFVSGGGGGGKKERWTRNDPPCRQWILQERSEFVDNMGAKRRSKTKGGAGRRQACSHRVGGGSEALDLIRGDNRGKPFGLRSAIC